MCSGSENYNRKTSKREAKCRGGEWSSKNSGSRKILVEFHVLCAVMCVSQSRFFIRRCLRVSIFFARQRGLEVPTHLFINDVFSSLGIEFH